MAEKTVIYWVSRALRTVENPALIHSQQLALEHGHRLIVVFNLYPDFPCANLRNMDFLLQGLVEMSQKLKRFNIPLLLLEGDAEKNFLELMATQDVYAIITEHQVLKPVLNAQDRVRARCGENGVSFRTINTACVVPVEIASPKMEYAAKTFRPKIMGVYQEYLQPIPTLIPHPQEIKEDVFDDVQYQSLLRKYPQWHTITKSTMIPGEDAALRQLDTFIRESLMNYDRRNEVDANGQSKLSAYLHFGMISPVKMIRDVEASGHPNAGLFVEEAMVRRELAENYCHYCKDYDSLDGAWGWAKATLQQHQSDPREYFYTFEEFRDAKTHDKLWNYCQKQVVETGYLHSYLRMYWAKMVLFWSKDARQAVETLIRFNDTYFLDGRDPNGYTGILWSVAAVHDRPWFDKPVHGLIRAMGSEGTLRKTKLKLEEEKIV